VTSLAIRPAPRRIRRRPLARRPRRPPTLAERELLSVAGAVGSPVHDAVGARVGSVEDLVVGWDTDELHPPLAGLLVRARLRRGFVPVEEIARLDDDSVRLRGRLVLHDVLSATGTLALARDVLDRQIVDVDGSDVARVSDLVLGRTPEGIRLVGADVSLRTLARRLGTPSMRRRVAADRVYDWTSVAAFSVRAAEEAGSVLALTRAAGQLRALPAETLEAMLGDLPPGERDRLAAHVAREPRR